MIYQDGWGEDDLLPDMDWCLQHGVQAHVPKDGDPYCWMCLSDSHKDADGNVVIKCRVINLRDALNRQGKQ